MLPEYVAKLSSPKNRKLFREICAWGLPIRQLPKRASGPAFHLARVLELEQIRMRFFQGKRRDLPMLIKHDIHPSFENLILFLEAENRHF
jgi:hypothetical protein